MPDVGTQQEETAMALLRHWFPIALAILWVAMAAMAIADFASFAATTQPSRAVAKQQQRPLHSTHAEGRPAVRVGFPRS
jgi:hypothetical protein